MGKTVPAKHFFRAVFQDKRGWAVMCGFPGGRFDSRTGPVESRWFRYPDQVGEMIDHVMENRNNDLYMPPTLYKTKGSRRAVNAKTGICVYADADDCHPGKFDLPPSMVVQTSPKRYQAYWIINTEDEDTRHLSTDELSFIGRRIAMKHADQGCDRSGWDVGQLLRVPGTTNNKPTLDTPWKVTAEVFSGAYYTRARLEEVYPPREGEWEAVVIEEMPEEKDLPSFDEAYDKISGDSDMIEMMDPADPPKDRSRLMWRFLHDMARMGLSPEDALVLGWQASYNKWRIKKRPKQEFWEEVCKAFSEFAAKPDYGEPDHGPELDKATKETWKKITDVHGEEFDQLKEEVTKHQPPGGLKFMTKEETKQVPKDTFVDFYMDWACERTDAAYVYQRAAAMMVLSTVFGDFAYPATKFKMGGLNLWFMILGGTTRSRKSTVRHDFLDVLHSLQDGAKYDYDLGSDVTPEALTVTLADRSGRSVLYNRDEAHGLLGETGAKSYLSGLKESLTELYDGFVRGRLRTTTPRTKSGTTCFNMWLSGVTDDVAQQLTARDFGSGFLARFIYVHAEPPDRTPESVRMEQLEGIDPYSVTVDTRKEELVVAPLARARQHWEKITQPGHQVPMGYTAEAWERINKFAWDVGTHAEKSEHREVLEATVDRLSKSLIKAGLLLAMFEGRQEAEMRHTLKAISLAEEWYSHLEFMAGKVKENSWQRQLDEIRAHLHMIAPQIRYSTLYKTFSKYTPKQFKELIEALVDTGEVRITFKNSTRIIEQAGQVG